ncbi:phage major capsid protein [Rhizobium sp. BK251]|uniref:phage major capsid protein n=1 Tax=Rhizobium sp. BK251 TaxID=2512125 RepID=UPI001043B064|nr:phage major capsid protein [Rhizobium sp. BK251]TCL70541.1 hypothetical protein EV286_107416 [Rhizobium sp. BK251]
MPTLPIGDIVATTIENRSRKAADNVTRNNGLLNRLQKRGSIEMVDGGSKIMQELEYAQNQTAMWYSGYENLNITPSQILTAAEYAIRQAAVAVTFSGLEELQNDGEERMINLIAKRVGNAETTLQSLISNGIYSDGTQPKEINGLQQLVAATPTNSVGGIDGNTWDFWRNITFGAVTDGGAAVTAANIVRYMDSIYVQLVRGADRPDIVVGDNNMWRLYNESLQPLQRISDPDTASAGFRNLMYQDAPVILDGGFQGYASDPVPPGGAPQGYMYFLNSKYVKYRPHPKRNFTAINPDRFSINQDATVRLVGWAGNLTISNRRLNGVLHPN